MFLTDSPSHAYRDIQGLASTIKSITENLHNTLATSDTGMNIIDEYFERLIRYTQRIDTIATTEGLVVYAESQHPDIVNYNVVAEYTTMITAVSGVVQWIIDNIPKDGNGYELTYTRNAAGQRVSRQFSSAATSGFRAELMNIITSIE